MTPAAISTARQNHFLESISYGLGFRLKHLAIVYQRERPVLCSRQTSSKPQGKKTKKSGGWGATSLQPSSSAQALACLKCTLQDSLSGIKALSKLCQNWLRHRRGTTAYLHASVHPPIVSAPSERFGLPIIKTVEATYSELRSCVKVEVAVLGSLSLISLVVSVDVKRHDRRSRLHS